MKTVGRIYGNSTTRRFTFAVIDPDSLLKRSSFIAFEHPSAGMVLARVSSLEYRTPTSAEMARKVSEGANIAGDSKYIGSAEIVGFRNEHCELRDPPTPPRPGIDVMLPDSDTIRKVLSGDVPEGSRLYVGKLKDFDVPIFLDANRVAQRHLSVLAKTGSGKSYVVGVLAEEIIKKGIPLVIIDPHGEYSSLAFPNDNAADITRAKKFGIDLRGYGRRMVEYAEYKTEAQPLRFSDVNLEAEDVLGMTGMNKNDVATGSLYRSVRALKESGKDYSLRDIINVLEEDTAAKKVMGELERLLNMGVFVRGGLDIRQLVKRDQVSIINLKGTSAEMQQIIVGRIISQLFSERKKETIPSHFIILEEAHNYAPQGSKGASLDPIRSVAAEGRKFGMGLCVVTQRPARVDKSVLSQCGTQILLKITNGNDLDAIAKSVENFEKGMRDIVQGLSIGEAMVIGGGIEFPIIIDVRPRETKHGGASAGLLADIESSEVQELIKRSQHEASVTEIDDLIGGPGKVKQSGPPADGVLAERILTTKKNGRRGPVREMDAEILDDYSGGNQ